MEKTALEKKYEGTGRFDFTPSQLANYEEQKIEREQKRLERRRLEEEEIKRTNELMEAERKLEREIQMAQEAEYEALKEKEKLRF